MTDRRWPMPEPSEKPGYVRRMFGDISLVYDRMNALMSLGLHGSWRRALVRGLDLRPGMRILDVCSGTGDVALELARQAGAGSKVVCLDFSREMLGFAEAKAEARGVGGQMEYVVADAMDMPFADGSFDRVTVAFGVRNFADVSRGFAEMARVLRPGGKLGCLELSKPASPVLRRLHTFYLHLFIPLAGRVVYGSRGPYDYLPASLVDFPVRDELAAKMAEVGLVSVRYRELAMGAVAIHEGVKP